MGRTPGPKDVAKFLPQGVAVDDVRGLSREQFLEELLPLFIEDEGTPTIG